jgi:endonuclease YncB( thermonuclease family)
VTYEYRAQLLSVHDGDTITVMLDQGLKEYRKMNIRLYGINAPELATQAGKDALYHLEGLLFPGGGHPIAAQVPLIIRTIKDAADKYGERWDGKVWLESAGTWGSDNEFVVTTPSLNSQMVIDGFAVVYP